MLRSEKGKGQIRLIKPLLPWRWDDKAMMKVGFGYSTSATGVNTTA
jgi:hypothetical protein